MEGLGSIQRPAREPQQEEKGPAYLSSAAASGASEVGASLLHYIDANAIDLVGSLLLLLSFFCVRIAGQGSLPCPGSYGTSVAEQVSTGSRGMGSISRTLMDLIGMGSVSLYLLHHLKIPVLVVKHPELHKARRRLTTELTKVKRPVLVLPFFPDSSPPSFGRYPVSPRRALQPRSRRVPISVSAKTLFHSVEEARTKRVV